MQIGQRRMQVVAGMGVLIGVCGQQPAVAAFQRHGGGPAGVARVQLGRKQGDTHAGHHRHHGAVGQPGGAGQVNDALGIKVACQRWADQQAGIGLQAHLFQKIASCGQTEPLGFGAGGGQYVIVWADDRHVPQHQVLAQCGHELSVKCGLCRRCCAIVQIKRPGGCFGQQGIQTDQLAVERSLCVANHPGEIGFGAVEHDLAAVLHQSACQPPHNQQAQQCCQGDGPQGAPLNVNGVHRHLWRLSVGWAAFRFSRPKPVPAAGSIRARTGCRNAPATRAGCWCGTLHAAAFPQLLWV